MHSTIPMNIIIIPKNGVWISESSDKRGLDNLGFLYWFRFRSVQVDTMKCWINNETQDCKAVVSSRNMTCSGYKTARLWSPLET